MNTEKQKKEALESYGKLVGQFEKLLIRSNAGKDWNLLIYLGFFVAFLYDPRLLAAVIVVLTPFTFFTELVFRILTHEHLKVIYDGKGLSHRYIWFYPLVWHVLIALLLIRFLV